MRHACPIVFALLLSACASRALPQDPDRIQTTSEANRASLKDAAEAPLRDLNMVRTKIPQVLLQAMADPYARPPRLPRLAGHGAQCDQLVQLIRPLNDALGADLDVPSQDEDDLVQKGRDTALGAAADVTSGVIPFRGWVRKLTGAERHDKLVQGAINAGAVRRAYLKGLGEAKGCDPPATASHELAGSPTPEDRRRPRYPVR